MVLICDISAGFVGRLQEDKEYSAVRIACKHRTECAVLYGSIRMDLHQLHESVREIDASTEIHKIHHVPVSDSSAGFSSSRFNDVSVIEDRTKPARKITHAHPRGPEALGKAEFYSSALSQLLGLQGFHRLHIKSCVLPSEVCSTFPLVKTSEKPRI